MSPASSTLSRCSISTASTLPMSPPEKENQVRIHAHPAGVERVCATRCDSRSG
jgi:hypothetical protein